jgi:pimeloyl-ACP methyl ester carboxylesterase
MATTREWPGRFSAVIAGGRALVRTSGAMLGWRRLKHYPAETDATRRAGLRGVWVKAGPYRMFARVSAHPPENGRLPVVLVHGLVISSRYMEPLAAILGRDFRVLAPDLPGFGESGKPRHILDVDELADALALWLKASGIVSAAFIGNSFGCQVLAALALRHPAVVDRLVLQGPTVDPAARNLVVQFWRDIINGRREPRPMGPLARIDYAKAGVRRALLTARVLIRDRIEDRLPLIEAPTLVLHGGRDPVSPQAWAEAATRLLPHGSLVVVEGATHTMNYTYPDEFAAAILPFLEEATQASLTTSEATR